MWQPIPWTSNWSCKSLTLTLSCRLLVCLAFFELKKSSFVNWYSVWLAIDQNWFRLELNRFEINLNLVQLKTNPVKKNGWFNSISNWLRVDQLGSGLTGLTIDQRVDLLTRSSVIRYQLFEGRSNSIFHLDFSFEVFLSSMSS